MTNLDPDREWTQEELRDYLISNGWKAESFTPGEEIPQGVKFISFKPLTDADIRRAQEIIAAHPEWGMRGGREQS